MVLPSQPKSEFWGIATFFNPANYANKRSNFLFFAARIRRQGLRLLVIELLFDGQNTTLPTGIGDSHIILRSTTVLWHKERLLNIGLAALPSECKTVAWLDGDVLFAHDDWISKAHQELETSHIIQLFKTAWFLPPPASPNQTLSQTTGWLSDAKRRSTVGAASSFVSGDTEKILKGRGHPGLAWAAKRDVLEHVGFYDRLILGGADTVMTFALFGFFELDSVRERFQTWWSAAHFSDVISWAATLRSTVDQRVGYISETIYHLWHGNKANRQYETRQFLLRDCDFDPLNDIRTDEHGCWAWNSDKPDLHEGVRRYFQTRQEDQIDPA
jgi:hypothetical protein